MARTSARSTLRPRPISRERGTARARPFCECKTYRYHGHHVGDIARSYYRPKAEEEEWVTERDPVTLHGQWLMANGVVDRAALDAIQEELVAEMDAAVEFAVGESYPDPSLVYQELYA